jgi:hypothetical protein
VQTTPKVSTPALIRKRDMASSPESDRVRVALVILEANASALAVQLDGLPVVGEWIGIVKARHGAEECARQIDMILRATE